MTSFINNVIVNLKIAGFDLSKLTFVLPNKRAGLFLKRELSLLTETAIFSPEILSIEEFTEELSELQYATNIELLFEFYEVYLSITPKKDVEHFDQFSKWAQLLIQDFNEIDRYLIPPKNIFNYLSAIKELNHWSLDENQSVSVKNYISFWNRLEVYYLEFCKQLLQKGKAYQGLVYREAVNNIEQYIASKNKKHHVFVGFNALNKAEETIIQELLHQDLASIYWDIDEVFMNNKIHDAGLFTRQHKDNWIYFKNNSFNRITKNYSKQKNIKVIGTPKNIGQVKHIGELLNEIKDVSGSLENTAIILGDENLLMPLLNSIPKEVNNINITMGLPVNSIPLSSLFEELFRIHKTSTEGFYYKNVIAVLSHPFIKPLLNSDVIIEYIQNNNIVYLTKEILCKIDVNHQNSIKLLFATWEDSPSKALKNCFELIQLIKDYLNIDKVKNRLPLEYLFRYYQIFNELQNLNETYSYITNINVLFQLYKELLKTETLDFKGEPLQGLQIMGMLESRVLDFETVIISSVNEGILPAGKSNNSFIPFDVKLENGLPTYKEKDAVYTYHFYRLLQRAKNVYILYNTEADVLNGGEKSRFIKQLEIENIHYIKHSIVVPQVPKTDNTLNSIKKNKSILEDLKNLANKGFSPSSLTSYIRNPMDFYFEKVLKIKSFNDVEETIAYNTLGNVIHQSIEDLYTLFIGQFLTIESLNKIKSKADNIVLIHFKSQYKEGDFTKGKNLIIFEIAKRYIHNFIRKEIETIKEGHKIKIIALEKSVETKIEIPKLGFPIILKGVVDRIDEYNGITRIIDYKTGKVKQNNIEIVNWEDISTDYDKYSKSFQLLTYAYMLHAENEIKLPIEAGIISFKNLNSGVLKFAKKDKPGAYAKKETLISEDTLNAFEIELKNLIIEICNPEIDFIEKEI